MSAMNNNKQDQIITASEFSPINDYKYIKPKINKSGGKSVGILNSESNKALYLSTPLMLTWGVSEFKDEATGRKSYNMSLQFPKDEYATDETTAFLKAMTEFQNKIKSDAIENSKEWLNKTKMTADVVDALFHPMLYYPKDPETGEPNTDKSPTLKIKLDYWDEEFNCEIYDVEHNILFPAKDGDQGPMELMPKATNVLTVIRCGGLWFANGKFGCTWRLVQSVVQPRATMKGRCLIKVDKASVEKLKEQASKQEADDQTSDDEVDKTVAQDSDDEESDVPVKEPEPAPVVEEDEEKPKPKKRKVVKRKVKE